MSYNLFLDDIRDPSQVGNYIYPVELRSQYRLEDWEICRSYEEFVACVKRKGLPEKVSFDHDLADIHYDPSTWTESFEYHEKTGYDCAKWLCEYCEERDVSLPETFVHSANPVGAENIKSYLKNYRDE